MPSTTEDLRRFPGRSQRSNSSLSSGSSFGRGTKLNSASTLRSASRSVSSRSSSSSFGARRETRPDWTECADNVTSDLENLVLEDCGPSGIRGRDERIPANSHGTSGRRISATCNYIRLDYSNMDNNTSTKEYIVTFTPSVDSKRERFYLTNRFFKDLGGKIYIYDGNSELCTPEQLPHEVNVTSIQLRSAEMEVRICFKFARIKKLDQCAPLFNVIFKRAMSYLKFIRFKQADYNPKAAIPIPQHQLQIWPGYVTNVSECENGIMLCCDSSFRVLRIQTCYDIMYDILHTGGSKSSDCEDELIRAFVGKSVMTNYRQSQTFLVDDIDFASNPKSTFTTKDGQEISFVNYYKTHYNITIQDQGQPLFVHRIRRKELGKEKTECLIYLIPELCNPTGLTDSMKSNFTLMRDIGNVTRPSPAERQAALSKLIEAIKISEKARQCLADWNLKIPNTTIDFTARVLEPPLLLFGAQKTSYEERADWGRTVSSSQALTPVTFRRWGIIYVRRNDRIVSDFIECFIDIIRKMGIEASRPQSFALQNEDTKNYCDELKRLAPMSPQILVIVCPSQREDRYKAIKKLCNTELGIITQVVNSRTISNRNTLRSVVGKIVVQMNCKIGGAPWGMSSIPYAEDGIMIAGIDVYNDKDRRNRSVVALVASTNSACTQWTSRTAEQNRGQVISDLLLPLIAACLESWKKKNRTYPSIIIVYRLGVNDGQLNVFENFEVPQFMSAFKLLGPDYHPYFTYIAVLKNTSTRLYRRDRNTFSNPPPGCIVDNTITNRKLQEFFLVSQHYHRGTASPTRFIVMTNSFLSMNIIEEISYKMTCMYFNWCGGVSVPAPCMYARKLATLVGECMHSPATDNLMDTTFFL